MTVRAVLVGLLLMLAASMPAGAQIDYQRPVDVAPTEKSIGGGYQVPVVQRRPPRSYALEIIDVGVLTAGLAATAWTLLVWRNRLATLAVSIVMLAYLGFYREGCVCPIGSIQNVAVALVDPNYSISYVVIAIFLLPLIASLFVGRVFCGGVCALGALQDLVLVRPGAVPPKLDRALGWLRYVYLVLAVILAVLPAANRDFIICRFDPFVGFFRRTGMIEILSFGAALLLLGLFIGRPYCRFLCPYGGLLALLARLTWRGVVPIPIRGQEGGLCPESCPYGAIDGIRVDQGECVSCARCYQACPREARQTRGPTLVKLTKMVGGGKR
ncbi:MAG: 4Fe-4S binding protein [Planctomycetes bacterium]|nr:4Fe-4S binding protein [Planctomycetota bacterium]